ncbi:hypothetical protein CSC17_5948 (plasmid) [Klebsiella oxytoca]|uniref:hypothetical protein n=1 Tax=Klebsiella oxytoca TaxID=571 RepID=UPI000D544CAE|nr:hypothetical protein [Klebsiella oxytoca]AWF33398.1 hypothetical protein CSC17_5948 [Klebsiella oxytoca]
MAQTLSLKNITVDCAVSLLQTYTRIALITMSGIFLAGYAAAGYAADPIKINIASDTGKGTWSATGTHTRDQICCTIWAGQKVYYIGIPPTKDSSLTGDVTASITGNVTSSNQNYSCMYDGLPVSVFNPNANIGGCTAPKKERLEKYNFVSNATLTINADLTNKSITEKTLTLNNMSIWFLGSYGFILNGTITVPAASQCTLSAPATLSLPDISAADLATKSIGTGIGEAVALPMQINCTPVLSSTLTLKPKLYDSRCIGTDLTGYAICIDNVDFSSGDATIGNMTNGEKVLYIRSGRGNGNVTPGKGTGVLTVTASPQ